VNLANRKEKKSGGIATHTKDLYSKKYFEEKTFEIVRFKL
jgi:hypothetical protein